MLHIVKNWREMKPDALVNGASLTGIASAPLVTEAADLHPGCELALADALKRGELVEGLVFPWETHRDAPRLILLVATRLDSKAEPKAGDLLVAVGSLRAYLLAESLRTVAVAAFADGLPREEVLRVLTEALGDLETEVVLEAAG